MKLLTEYEKNNLSFPDSVVEAMNIDELEKKAYIQTDHAYLDISDGINLKNCRVLINDWEKLDARLYRTSTKKWEYLDLPDIDKLTDICEFDLIDGVVFRGFGEKTGQWIEIKFLGSNIEVMCEARGQVLD